MKFRTEIKLPSYPFDIRYDHQLLFLGSCFSENVSTFFAEHQFQVTANPFGILFNPLSIAQALDFAAQNKVLDEHYFHFFNEKWLSFAHHGCFSHPDPEIFATHISQSLEKAKNALQSADFLFITFGTSYYYWHKEKELVVANCHKLPSDTFEKRRASVQETVSAFAPFFQWKKRHRPGLKVILTVSPVRHLGDGFHENQLSKSLLHLATEELCQQHDNVYYFPSYEIYQDDLRDYRFYADDLCHPSAQGVDYVIEKVKEAFLTADTLRQVDEADKALRRSRHVPLLQWETANGKT